MSDLFIGPDVASGVEREAVAAALAAAGMTEPAILHETERLVRGGKTRAKDRRHLLLPALHSLQNAAGWISPGGINHIAETLAVPPAEAYGVATFYDMFRSEAPEHSGPTMHVCVDAACQIADPDATIAAIEAGGGHAHRSPCLGQCERAVAQFLQSSNGGANSVPADSDPAVASSFPQSGSTGLRLMHRVGVVDPESLESYRASGGYAALSSAVEMGSEAVIEAISASGLSGRGGAAFPTGVKWRAVAGETGRPKHVVANADESEPGTFKDRVLMEGDPFAIVEALTVAGVTVGAENGWIYIRGEYPLATTRLENAISSARAAGLLGDNVMGSGHSFDITLRRGAGAYICGEETALFNSIEGYRGEPRNKPPFPTTHGLFGEPTAINNPETLLNVLDIVRRGVEAYRSVGTEGSPGTKLFCLSGNVGAPGVYEVDFGMTLGELLELAGGVQGELQTVLLGGAAGSFVGPDMLELPLTIEASRAAGVSLGSGVVMAFNTDVDMVPVVTRLAEFFRDESCGQCVPCRVGTVRQHEVLLQIGSGPIDDTRRQLIDDMAVAMIDASICGLGHTASGAVRSALDLGLIGAPS
ncbi:MAG: NADH-quinone oxidoreductase subunit F [Candidatus Poriferisodalaceae bacterium]